MNNIASAMGNVQPGCLIYDCILDVGIVDMIWITRPMASNEIPAANKYGKSLAHGTPLLQLSTPSLFLRVSLKDSGSINNVPTSAIIKPIVFICKMANSL